MTWNPLSETKRLHAHVIPHEKTLGGQARSLLLACPRLLPGNRAQEMMWGTNASPPTHWSQARRSCHW
jgi:hypothetical protein